MMSSEFSSLPYLKKKSVLKLFTCISFISLLAGCASNPHESFSPPDYSYLPKMNLSIAHLDVIDQAVPKNKSTLTAKSPSPPDQSLALMAHQRLNPTGNNGKGTFTITDARISKKSHNIFIGNLAVRLVLDDPSNGKHAEVTAHVTHQDNVSGDNSKQHDLYELNKHLMDDMNVELEYQIRKNMGDWLTDATGAPLNATVKTQNLDNINDGQINGQSTPIQASVPTNAQPAPNTASSPSSDAQRPHSPPMGYLHLPQ